MSSLLNPSAVNFRLQLRNNIKKNMFYDIKIQELINIRIGLWYCSTHYQP